MKKGYSQPSQNETTSNRRQDCNKKLRLFSSKIQHTVKKKKKVEFCSMGKTRPAQDLTAIHIAAFKTVL